MWGLEAFVCTHQSIVLINNNRIVKLPPEPFKVCIFYTNVVLIVCINLRGGHAIYL